MEHERLQLATGLIRAPAACRLQVGLGLPLRPQGVQTCVLSPARMSPTRPGLTMTLCSMVCVLPGICPCMLLISRCDVYPCVRVRRLRTPLRPLHGQLQDMHPCALTPPPSGGPKQTPDSPRHAPVRTEAGDRPVATGRLWALRRPPMPCTHACLQIPKFGTVSEGAGWQHRRMGLMAWQTGIMLWPAPCHGVASRWHNRDSPADRLQSATKITSGTATRSTAGATTQHPPPSPKVSQATPPAAWHLSGLA